MLATNLTASFDMGKRAAALMARHGGGRIILVTSIAGRGRGSAMPPTSPPRAGSRR